MQSPLNRVIRFFSDNNIKSDKAHFLLASSGGIDSMVMAHLLLKLNLAFDLVHCNFKLRGKESDDDQEFIEKFTHSKGVSIHTKCFNTATYSTEKGISIQMAARELRYEYFDALMAKHKFHYLLTAHHLDDSLETLLINLGRGTGIMGLGGIPSFKNKMLRPLHLCSRAEINRYAEENRIEWREDSSNKKTDYQRNYIRHQVSPALKAIHDHYENNLRHSLINIAEDLDLFRHQLEQIERAITFEKDNHLYIDIPKLKSYPSTSSILNFILSPYGRFDLKSIIGSLQGQSGALFESENYELIRDRDHLILSEKISHGTFSNYFINETDKSIETPLKLETGIIERNIFEISGDEQIGSFDLSKLSFPLELRKWKNGDSFIPLGMKRSKKLSDFFIDKKISRLEKSRTWLLCSGKDIIWVVGHRINEKYKITNKTKSVYFVRLLK